MHNAYINENCQRRYHIKVIKFCFLPILYDNIHDFAYNRWQHGTWITQQSVNIKISHVPKRGALHMNNSSAIFNLFFAIEFFAMET